MLEGISHDRGRFLATALMTIASAELGTIGSSSAIEQGPNCNYPGD